jgi:hypothetical protein
MLPTTTNASRSPQPYRDQRILERKSLILPARLTWKDQRGATRFASVVTRNISEQGVYVECMSTVSITLYRLVQFQLEPDSREGPDVPESLRHGRLLSAVYRVSPPKGGARQGIALRLLVLPKRHRADSGALATA